MKTILYAENDENDVFFMTWAFKKAGSPGRLVIVPDGQKAVDYVQGRDEFADRVRHPSPGLVLLDLKMPNLTGIEALREIRANPGGRELHVVLLTSSTQDADIAAAHTLKANGYFVKPSNATELIELLKSLAAIDATKNQPTLARLEIKGNRLIG